MKPKTALLTALLFAAAFGASLKGQFHLTPGQDQYRFYVKFNKELRTDVVNGVPQFFNAPPAAQAEISGAIGSLRFNQILNYSSAEKSAIRTGTVPPSARPGYARTDFSGFLELQGSALLPKDSLLTLAKEFESLAEVEYVSIEPVTPPPPPGAKNASPAPGTPTSTPPPTSQNWTPYQYYLYGDQANNVSGIRADWAWSQGIFGQNVKIADIEWGWDYQHEEFNNPTKFVDALTTTNHTYDNHGTAVLGEMMATNNGFGVTGAVHGVDKFYGFSEITKGRPAAILQALDSLKKGDVLVYEMQTGGGKNGGYVPADWDVSVWNLTKTATDAGIIVVAAAGNGGENLDDPACASYNARGDNGGIIVGAAQYSGRTPYYYSSYGSRVNVCGIGGGVYSTGYGDLQSGLHTDYTAQFSGTSSSTPIVASAVTAIQSYAKTKLGKIVSPKDMRALLIATGTPQGAGVHIGPLPNIQAAVTKLIADSSGTVTSYTITSSVNNGSWGSISPNGSTTVSSGGSQVYTFAANTGYQLDSVKVDGSKVTVTGNSYTVSNVTSNRTIAAYFGIKPVTKFTVTATVNNGSFGSITPTTATVDSNTTKTFTVTANAGCQIDSVKCGTVELIGTAGSYTTQAITANANVIAYLSLKPITKFTINASVNNGSFGSITPTTATVDSNTTKTFTVTANAGYQIDSVKCGSVKLTGTADSYTTQAITANANVIAYLSLKPITKFTINASVNNGSFGSITPTTATVDSNTTKTFTVTANAGYQIDSVKCGTVKLTGTAGSYTTQAIMSNANVAAYLSKIPVYTTKTTETHKIGKDTVKTVTSAVQPNKDTVVTTISKEIKTDTTVTVVDSLKDDVIYGSKTTESVKIDTTITVDTTFDTLDVEVAVQKKCKGERTEVKLSANPLFASDSKVVFTLPAETVRFRLVVLDAVGNVVFAQDGESKTVTWDLTNRNGIRVSGSFKAAAKITTVDGKVKIWDSVIGIHK